MLLCIIAYCLHLHVFYIPKITLQLPTPHLPLPFLLLNYSFPPLQYSCPLPLNHRCLSFYLSHMFLHNIHPVTTLLLDQYSAPFVGRLLLAVMNYSSTTLPSALAMIKVL